MATRKILNKAISFSNKIIKRPLRNFPAVLNKAKKTAPAKFYYFYFTQPSNLQHGIIDESVVLSLVQGKTVLDCGCGIGRWGYLLRNKGFTVVGFDIKKSNLLEAKKYSKYQDLLLASASCPPFKDDAFDCLTAIELLEHLPKEQGRQFLHEMKRITRQKIVLSTPSGFFEALCDLPEEIHQAGWVKEELEEQGFFCSVRKNKLYDWLLCTFVKI